MGRKHFTTNERLLPNADGFIVTKNILKPEYRWCGDLIKMENFKLNCLTITKNVVTEHHISFGKLQCNKKFKTCTRHSKCLCYVHF